MRRILLVCCLLLALMVAPSNAQDDEEPPYLFYYSRILGGLVIERADGTDSRLIAEDVIPAGYAGISGSGWSPSGRYFATYTITPSLSGATTGRPVVIDLEGNEVTPWFQVVGGSTWLMQWSPNGDDTLFVASSYRSDPTLGALFWLYDAANDQLLTDFGAYIGSFSTNTTPIQWDEANDRIIFYIRSEVARQDYRVTMFFDGTVLREPVDRDTYEANMRQYSPGDGWDLFHGEATSPSGTYTTEGFLPALLTNTITGETIELPTHSQGTSCRGYLWEPEENYYIGQTGTVIAGGGCYPFVTGVGDVEGNFWRELGGCSGDASCIGWLPQSVNIIDLPPGSEGSILLDPVVIEPSDRIPGTADAHMLPIRVRCTDQLTETIMNIDTGQILYELVEVPCPYPTDYYQAEAGAPVVIAYDASHDLLAVYFPLHIGDRVSVWTRRDDDYEPVLLLNTYGYELEFTDDGEYLRARNVNGWEVYAVEDILSRLEG